MRDFWQDPRMWWRIDVVLRLRLEFVRFAFWVWGADVETLALWCERLWVRRGGPRVVFDDEDPKNDPPAH